MNQKLPVVEVNYIIRSIPNTKYLKTQTKTYVTLSNIPLFSCFLTFKKKKFSLFFYIKIFTIFNISLIRGNINNAQLRLKLQTFQISTLLPPRNKRKGNNIPCYHFKFSFLFLIYSPYVEHAKELINIENIVCN